MREADTTTSPEPQTASAPDRQSAPDGQQPSESESPEKPSAGPSSTDEFLYRFKIIGLVKKAEFDIAEGRYTSPVGNNALQKYREVLRLNPGNQAATEGLAVMTDKIVSELDSAIASGDTTLEAVHLAELKQVAPNHPRLAQ